VLILAADVQRIAHFIHRSWPESIPVTFAVNGNFPDSVEVIKKNVFVFFNGFPVAFCIHKMVVIDYTSIAFCVSLCFRVLVANYF